MQNCSFIERTSYLSGQSKNPQYETSSITDLDNNSSQSSNLFFAAASDFYKNPIPYFKNPLKTCRRKNEKRKNIEIIKNKIHHAKQKVQTQSKNYEVNYVTLLNLNFHFYSRIRQGFYSNFGLLVTFFLDKILPTSLNKIIINKNLQNGIKNDDIIKIHNALTKGADLNYQDKDGATPLMLTIKNYIYSISLEMIESQKINLNIQDKDGNTALIYALQRQQIGIAKKIIESNNACLIIENNNGDTALLIAIQKKLIDIINVIQEKMPKIQQTQFKILSKFLRKDEIGIVLKYLVPTVDTSLLSIESEAENDSRWLLPC